MDDPAPIEETTIEEDSNYKSLVAIQEKEEISYIDGMVMNVSRNALITVV